jgi:hypothetical protein
MSLPLSQRVWLIPALIAVIALGACATGAAPCAIAKPIGLIAAAGAALLIAVEDDPATSVG